MKKVVFVVCGLLLGNAAMACNMDVQDCTDFLSPDIVKYNNELKKNQAFQKDGAAVKDWQNRTQSFKQKVDSCSTNKCVNQKFLDYHRYVIGLVKTYRPLAEQKTAAKPAVKSNDPWMDQCVIGKKAETQVYLDEHRLSMFGGRRIVNTVIQATGEMVAFMDKETGSRVWAKKEDLEMQDLRNCN